MLFHTFEQTNALHFALDLFSVHFLFFSIFIDCELCPTNSVKLLIKMTLVQVLPVNCISGYRYRNKYIHRKNFLL